MEASTSKTQKENTIKMSKVRQRPIPGPLRLSKMTPSQQIRRAFQRSRSVQQGDDLRRSILCGHRFQHKYYECAINRAFISMLKLGYTDREKFTAEFPNFMEAIIHYRLVERLWNFESLRVMLRSQ